MRAPATSTPTGYAGWLAELKTRIRETRVRAALAVNSELIGLYWCIGHDILERQAQDGWGSKVVDRLAIDLRTEFPDTRGFSSANLRYMRAFAEAWPDPAILQRVIGKLPWGQNIELLGVKDAGHRLWYAEAALAHLVGDAAERAYARSDLFEKRREMMEAWAMFLAQRTG